MINLQIIFGSQIMYIDPSVMTYAIQAIAGIVIAVGAVVGIYWRRARKKLNDTLGIDEDKNKTVEDDIVVYSESDDAEKQGKE